MIYAFLQIFEIAGIDHAFSFILALILTLVVAKFIHSITGMFPVLFGTREEKYAEAVNNEKVHKYYKLTRKL